MVDKKGWWNKREREQGNSKGCDEQGTSSYFRQSLSLDLSIGTSSGKNNRTLWQKVPENLRSSAYITKWLHNSQCDERCSIKERKREISAPTFETQINAIIHWISWRNQTHLKKCAENILENYTPERALGRDLWRTPKSFLKSIIVRNAVDLLLEFRDSEWKGVDFRHLADRPDSELEKRVWERTWEVSTRKVTDGEGRGNRQKKDREERSYREEFASANAGSQFVTVRRFV